MVSFTIIVQVSISRIRRNASFQHLYHLLVPINGNEIKSLNAAHVTHYSSLTSDFLIGVQNIREDKKSLASNYNLLFIYNNQIKDRITDPIICNHLSMDSGHPSHSSLQHTLIQWL